MNIRERVGAAELRFEDAKSLAYEAEKATQEVRRQIGLSRGRVGNEALLGLWALLDRAIIAEYIAVYHCLDLQDELRELERVLATGIDPHAAIMEGAL